MLTEINKIIGRDFIVGFFIPALAFVAATMGLLSAFDIELSWLQVKADDPLKDTTFVALITVGIAFCQMAVNRVVFRALEGYWPLGLGTCLKACWTRRFRRLQAQIDALSTEKKQCQKASKPFAKVAELNRLELKAVQRFPSKESLILPTGFGNTVRAFEDYPRVMYKFESIQGWSRLRAVIPKEFSETLGSMRATTDLWVNTWFLGLAVTVEYLAIVVLGARQIKHVWIPLACVAVAVVASRRARAAAEQWGESVKAAFDLFLPKLAAQLGYKRPATEQEERDFWTAFSNMILYRKRKFLVRLEPWRTAAELDGAGNGDAPTDEEAG